MTGTALGELEPAWQPQLATLVLRATVLDPPKLHNNDNNGNNDTQQFNQPEGA